MKKIMQLEKTARASPELLPPLEIAILNDKQYLIKRHSVFEALRLAGITEFRANLHTARTLNEVVSLHAKMSQVSPVNPLAVLDLRDYLLRNGVAIDDISKTCCLDPSYERLLLCTLSYEAKKQLSLFLNVLSKKLTRVVLPTYVIEIISKKPQEIQVDIVKAIVESIGDESVLNDRDFYFPNPDQVRLFADLYKNPTERKAIILEKEFEEKPSSEKSSKSRTKLDDGKNNLGIIVENIPHMAIMDLGIKKYRVDWKNKTFTEINENEKPGFIVLRDNSALQKFYTLSPSQIKFLNLTSGQDPQIKVISSAKQFHQLAEKINKVSKFRGILICNYKI